MTRDHAPSDESLAEEARRAAGLQPAARTTRDETANPIGPSGAAPRGLVPEARRTAARVDGSATMSVRDVAGEVATDIGLGLIDRVVLSAHLLVLGAGAVALGTVAFIAAAIALVVLSPLLTTVMGETTGPQAAAALSIALFLGLAFILVRWLVMTVGRRLERITARVEEAAAELLVGDASALGRARDEG